MTRETLASAAICVRQLSSGLNWLTRCKRWFDGCDIETWIPPNFLTKVVLVSALWNLSAAVVSGDSIVDLVDRIVVQSLVEQERRVAFELLLSRLRTQVSLAETTIDRIQYAYEILDAVAVFRSGRTESSAGFVDDLFGYHIAYLDHDRAALLQGVAEAMLAESEARHARGDMASYDRTRAELLVETRRNQTAFASKQLETQRVLLESHGVRLSPADATDEMRWLWPIDISPEAWIETDIPYQLAMVGFADAVASLDESDFVSPNEAARMRADRRVKENEIRRARSDAIRTLNTATAELRHLRAQASVAVKSIENERVRLNSLGFELDANALNEADYLEAAAAALSVEIEYIELVHRFSRLAILAESRVGRLVDELEAEALGMACGIVRTVIASHGLSDRKNYEYCQFARQN